MSRYITINTDKNIPNPGISDTKNVFGSGNYRVFNSSCNWTVPSNVGKVRVSLFGAGGGAGGHWTAFDGGITGFCCSVPQAGCCLMCYLCGCCATYINFMIYDGMFSYGGAGGGGSYTVGSTTVTPGCSCCISVGAGGTTGCSRSYWIANNCHPGFIMWPCKTCYMTCGCYANTGFCCAANGTSGGFTCAFGFCAPGGEGGQGGYCGYCALANNAWFSNTCFGSSASCPWCVCLAAQCVCGGSGGSCGNGNIISYCGGQGDSGGYVSTNTTLSGGQSLIATISYGAWGTACATCPVCATGCYCNYGCMCCTGPLYGCTLCGQALMRDVTAPSSCYFLSYNCPCIRRTFLHPMYCGVSGNLCKTSQQGGSAGSPLGSATGTALPNPFNGLAFNNCCWSSGQVTAYFDLPAPKWPGQIIYSQIPGETGSPTYYCSACLGSSGSGWTCCVVCIDCNTPACTYCSSTVNCCTGCCAVCCYAGFYYCSQPTISYCGTGLWTGANTRNTCGFGSWCAGYVFVYYCVCCSTTAPCCCFTTVQYSCVCESCGHCIVCPCVGGGSVSPTMSIGYPMLCYVYGTCIPGGSGQAIVEW